MTTPLQTKSSCYFEGPFILVNNQDINKDGVADEMRFYESGDIEITMWADNTRNSSCLSDTSSYVDYERGETVITGGTPQMGFRAMNAKGMEYFFIGDRVRLLDGRGGRIKEFILVFDKDHHLVSTTAEVSVDRLPHTLEVPMTDLRSRRASYIRTRVDKLVEKCISKDPLLRSAFCFMSPVED